MLEVDQTMAGIEKKTNAPSPENNYLNLKKKLRKVKDLSTFPREPIIKVLLQSLQWPAARVLTAAINTA